ncbi:MAG: alpha/beta fold hydrolase, partial [Allorhizobium sp.]
STADGEQQPLIILGHSMGGIAARAAYLMRNFRPGSIQAIITLSTPHQRWPRACGVAA